MGSTAVNNLPDEILQDIFIRLSGKDILNIRRVCCRWQSVVDNFTEKFWKRLCSKNYASIYEDGYRVSGLNWRELYNSFSLWENVADAEVGVSLEPVGELHEIHVLKNSVISFPKACKADQKPKYYDTIVYYDVKTRNEINRITYDEGFYKYEENDDIIVFEIEEDTKIRVVPKVNEDKYVNLIVKPHRHWLLLGNEIFYQTENDVRTTTTFWRMRVIIDDKDVRYENSELAKGNWDNWDYLDVKYVGDKTYVFEGYEEFGDVYIAEIKNECRIVCGLQHLDTSGILETIKKYGFSWSNPKIFFWLTCCFSRNWEKTTFCIGSELLASPRTYSSHIFTGTRQPKAVPGIVHIFLNASNNIKLHELEPTLSINIDDSVPENIVHCRRYPYDNYLNQLEVIETVNGHKLLLVYCQRLIIIDITHKDYKQ